MFITGNKETGFKIHFSFPIDLVAPPIVPAAQPVVRLDMSAEKAYELECKLEEALKSVPTKPGDAETARQVLENKLVREYMSHCNWPMPDTTDPSADYSDLETATEQVRWFMSQLSQHLSKPQLMIPIPKYGEHMSMTEFVHRVACDQSLLDQDGDGLYATATEMLVEPHIIVKPSMVEARTLDTHWTHIVWFNK